MSKQRDTSNMLSILSTILAENAISMINMSDKFDTLVNAEHTKGEWK